MQLLDCMSNNLWVHHVTCLHAHMTVLHLYAMYVAISNAIILCADRKPRKVNRPRSDSQEFLPENEYAEIPRTMVNPGKH